MYDPIMRVFMVLEILQAREPSWLHGWKWTCVLCSATSFA